ncbi:MAG: cysteine desulfurase [Calditrichaeota bacterium]|nr:cysteine desulfurase [Calditrichota bacterium]
MESVYLDNAATTRPEAEVVAAMKEALQDFWGNPSSIHEVGRWARVRLEEARQHVANLMGCTADEIVFTSGGTEADNLAILGVLDYWKEKRRHVITAATEHHAVLDTVHWCQSHGFEATILPVDSEGRLDPADVKKAIRPTTALISLMFINNEIGTVHDIAEIGKVAREVDVVFHTDAVQAFGILPFSVAELQVDLMSVSSHKIYGPKGVGALYVKKGTRIKPRTHGGSQERGVRTGTENVPGIIGFGKACQICQEKLSTVPAQIQALRDRLEKEILERIDDVRINGSRTHRAPGILNCSFIGCEGEALLVGLDMQGICVSTGSACQAGSTGASHVLRAIGLSPEMAQASLRFSLGRNNRAEDVDAVMEFLPGIVKRLRQMSPVG